MGRIISKEQLQQHKEEAIAELSAYLDSLIESQDNKQRSKADKLSYWLKDWTTFLNFESNFSPRSLKRYKRGEIIKAHLGFNVGSEEGGLHYCVILDKNNSRNSSTVTVAPLTSLKPNTNIEHLYPGSVYLGNELFTNLNSKVSYTNKLLTNRLNQFNALWNEAKDVISDEQALEFLPELREIKRDLDFLNRMNDEVSKMKRGSIALISQIRTISKIRIYDPKTNFDILSGVRLSNEKLDLLDQELLKIFTKGI